MIATLVFTCRKDRKLTPVCIELLERHEHARIILCDDADNPSGISGYPVVPWSMRGEGGWAGGVSRAIAAAHLLAPDCGTIATVDSDIMVIDPGFFDLPEGVDARGCPRPRNQGWFSLRAFRAGLIESLQEATGRQEDKIIGEILKQSSSGAFIEDGKLFASQKIHAPVDALHRLGCHAIHVGQFTGDHQDRIKALKQAKNIRDQVAQA